MKQAEFDKFAEEYYRLHASNLAVSGESPEYFLEYKVLDLARELARNGITGAPRILDFGAGVGGAVPYVGKHLSGATLTCTDVSQASLAVASKRFPDAARYIAFDGTTLPFPDGEFDVAYTACVFHHIEETDHVRLLSEIRRVLRLGGIFMMYEHNPHNPLTVRTVRNCEFDANAKIFTAAVAKKRVTDAGFSQVTARYRVFFPHALRALRPLESRLSWLPLGAQYYVLARR